MGGPGGKSGFEDDAASRYLRRMQGHEDASASAPAPSSAAPPPLRDARSGRIIGGGPRQTPAPTAPDPLTALQTPYTPAAGADPLPPGAPRVTVASPSAPGPPTAQPGQLPPWFAGQGLSLLRAMQYPRAAAFYQDIAEKHPQNAEGWLGIGAAMFGTNELKHAATYLSKGHELDPAFPIGALVAEARPGDPRLLLDLAQVFVRQNTRPSLLCAIMVLEECQASPLLSEKMYLKAEGVKRKARETLELIEAKSNPAMLAMKKSARHNRAMSGLVKVAFVCVVLGSIGLVAWSFQRHTQAQALIKQGTTDYVAAWRAANLGTGRRGQDPVEMFSHVCDELREAVSLDGSLFEGEFMLNRTGQVLLQYVSEGRASKLSARQLQEVNRSVYQTRIWLKKADPTGEKAKTQNTNLQQQLGHG